MSVGDALFEELEKKCKQKNLDFKIYFSILKKILMGEDPIAYYFGVGIVPENSNTLIDMIVVTSESLIGFDIELNKWSTSRTKISIYNHVMVEKNQHRIQIHLLRGENQLGGGYYINNYLDKEPIVWEFVQTLHSLGIF